MIQKRPLTCYLLIVLVTFQAISAIPTGSLFIIDATGESLGFPINMLNNSPFSSFLIPGLFLLIILGLFPAFLAYGLIKKNESQAFREIQYS